MNEENKLAISCFAFIATTLIFYWFYHMIKYHKSNYGKFEYYCNGETEMANLLMFVNFIIQVLFWLFIIILGGSFFKYLFL